MENWQGWKGKAKEPVFRKQRTMVEFNKQGRERNRRGKKEATITRQMTICRGVKAKGINR